MMLENRFSHRSPMQTEKYQPEGKRRMPETRFTEFSAFSVDPRVGISRSEKYQPEGKRITLETKFSRVSGIIRCHDGSNFSVCNGDR